MAGLCTVAACGGLGGESQAPSSDRRRSSAFKMSERALGIGLCDDSDDDDSDEDDEEEDEELEMTTKLRPKMASMETLEELDEEEDRYKGENCTAVKIGNFVGEIVDCNDNPAERAIEKRSNWKFRRVRMKLLKKVSQLPIKIITILSLIRNIKSINM